VLSGIFSAYIHYIFNAYRVKDEDKESIINMIIRPSMGLDCMLNKMESENKDKDDDK
jgi:hypothetical protein